MGIYPFELRPFAYHQNRFQRTNIRELLSGADWRNVRSNICFGNPDATEQEMIEAAKKACCHALY
jgi:ABC-type transport system involved in cytochrome bd biosynthesis fused ATPase/permease subunit